MPSVPGFISDSAPAQVLRTVFRSPLRSSGADATVAQPGPLNHMGILSLLPKELLQGHHAASRIDPKAGFITCAFIRHPVDRPGGGDQQPGAVKVYGLSYALSGTATYVDRTGDRHALRPGAIFQFSEPDGPSTARLEPENGFLECTVGFHPTIGAKLEQLGIWRSSFIYAGTEPSASLLQRYLDLYRQMEASPIAYDEALRGIIRIVDLAYARAASASASERMIDEACRLLADGIAPRTSPREVAKELDVPFERFRRMFARQVGMPPQAYQLRQRMMLACDLLRSASVKEVAARLGYRNQFLFSRQFRQVIGAPPKTFKR